MYIFSGIALLNEREWATDLGNYWHTHILELYFRAMDVAQSTVLAPQVKQRS